MAALVHYLLKYHSTTYLVGKPNVQYSRYVTGLLEHLEFWNNFTWTDYIVWAVVG